MADPLADNPDDLDEPAEVRAFLQARGHDPMDTGTQEQAQFGNAILQGWADEPPADRGGRSDRVTMLEWEMVASELAEDYGVTDVERPPIDGDFPDWLEGDR